MAKQKTKKAGKHPSDWLFWIIVAALIVVIIGAVKYGNDSKPPVQTHPTAVQQQPASESANPSDMKVKVNGQETDTGFKIERIPANKAPGTE